MCCQAGRNRPRVACETGSTSCRSAASERLRSRRRISASTHSLPDAPGRNSPSMTRRSPASRRSESRTTATPSPNRSAIAFAVNGPWVRAKRLTRSPTGSATGSMNAVGTPMGSGTPRASRRRLASSITAHRSAPLIRAGSTRCARLELVEPAGDDRSESLRRRAVRRARRRESGPSTRSRSATPSRPCALRSGASLCSSSSVCARTTRVEQFAQFRATEKLRQESRVEAQCGGATFCERGVALVHERRDVSEQQRTGERRCRLGLHLDDPDAATRDLRGEGHERRQVVDVLEHLPHGLEHDRKTRVLARDLEQLRGPLPLLPERGSLAGVVARKQQRSSGALAEPRGEQRGSADLVRHDLLELRRLEQEQVCARGLGIRVGHAHDDAVVGGDGRAVVAESLANPRGDRERPGRVHGHAIRRMQDRRASRRARRGTARRRVSCRWERGSVATFCSAMKATRLLTARSSRPPVRMRATAASG